MRSIVRGICLTPNGGECSWGWRTDVEAWLRGWPSIQTSWRGAAKQVWWNIHLQPPRDPSLATFEVLLRSGQHFYTINQGLGRDWRSRFRRTYREQIEISYQSFLPLASFFLLKCSKCDWVNNVKQYSIIWMTLLFVDHATKTCSPPLGTSTVAQHCLLYCPINLTFFLPTCRSCHTQWQLHWEIIDSENSHIWPCVFPHWNQGL